MQSDEELLRGEAAVPPQSFNPTAMSRLEWRPVVRFPEQLRLHRALEEIGWTVGIDELNAAARPKQQSLLESIFITSNGTIFSGFGYWRLALLERRRKIDCIEYPVSDDDALQIMITQHRFQRGWNDFVRIRLALRQKPDLQESALDNMRAGGKHKGSTNWSKVDRKDVRKEIANIAGTGTSNVSKVETILQKAHPNIIAALQNSLLRIDRAWQWCKLSKSEQKKEFARFEEERTARKILREFLRGHSEVFPEPMKVIEALQQEEARQPGSVQIRTSCSIRTKIIVGRDLLARMDTQREANLHG